MIQADYKEILIFSQALKLYLTVELWLCC